MDKTQKHTPLDANQTLLEIAERGKRVESRLVQLGDYVGANIREKQRIEVHGMSIPGNWTIYVEVDSEMFSFARVRDELNKEYFACLPDGGQKWGVESIPIKLRVNERTIYEVGQINWEPPHIR